ncbi:GNAT family N-acetyltransferase [Thioalkalivibrio denitrificans]|uniref:GNAT family N-acetyltransferase n=1 Tax=Thioalkalivibrio denitrificans TaxID=108003 RepID=A0A1V3NHT0_9GAMM|nr:GNAT family N-acetyltransferase [Thioalkalivibrio denitrificans]OOG24544.1 GNAT family N-acetyltransferase [Thioalkalivibrio denitrificans]
MPRQPVTVPHQQRPADKPGFQVSEAQWPRDAEALRSVREAVFVREQGVPLALERDGLDLPSLHLIARDADGHPIGAARLAPNGRIGRMAVLPAWRGRGVGRALLAAAVKLAKEQGLAKVELHAQCQASGFYREAGFLETGDVFMDAGIPHVRMVQRIDNHAREGQSGAHCA